MIVILKAPRQSSTDLGLIAGNGSTADNDVTIVRIRMNLSTQQAIAGDVSALSSYDGMTAIQDSWRRRTTTVVQLEGDTRVCC